MTPAGNFIIAWQSWGQEDTSNEETVDYGIYAQMFNADGSRNGGEIHVNTNTRDDQFYPDVAVNDNGDFLITWTSWNSTSTDYSEIAAQLFDKHGKKSGNEFIVNTTRPEYQWLPCATLSNDGSFAIAWSSWKQDKSREGVYLQFFNSQGMKKRSEQQINTYTDSYQWEPQIISLANGDVISVYSSWNQDGDDYGIFMRLMRAY